MVRLEIEEYLRGSFLENAPIVPVSVRTGAGLDDLKVELHRAAEQVSGKDSMRRFRLPLDRAFSMKGFGAVATGTLVSGSVAIGDEVELLPPRKLLRIRGLQSAGKATQRSVAGLRTAVNLAGIEHSALQRGMTLAEPRAFHASRRIDVRLELLASANSMKQRSRVHFHTGTAETVAEVYLYGQAELLPGQSSLAHLRLQDEVMMLPGDHFIIRQFSPVLTIGGGTVQDVLTSRPLTRDKDRVPFLRALENGDKKDRLAAMLERAPFGLAMDNIVARTGWLDTEILNASNELIKAGRARTVSASPLQMVPAASFAQVLDRLSARIDQFHKANPLSPGITREDLRSTLPRRVKPETFRSALEELVTKGKVELRGEIVKRAGSTIQMDPEELLAKEQIEHAFADAGLRVPPVPEVLGKLPVDPQRAEKILQLLLREKILVRITTDLIFHKEALVRLREMLVRHKQTKGESVSVPAFKDLTGITRKYAIPLLEYLDRERVTRRIGDQRVIL